MTKARLVKRCCAMIWSMRNSQLYNDISSTYAVTRRQDDRVAAQIHQALADADRIINVGAGTGNYEPGDRSVVAVEPSTEMIVRRPSGRAPVVQAEAEALPFPAGAFDAGLATLTLHHWWDRRRGLTEMRRVARRQVIFMFDPEQTYRFWAIDYWPTALSLPSEQDLPSPEDLGDLLDIVEVTTVAVPFDCTDGFGAAFWGRPDAYLNPDVQRACPGWRNFRPMSLPRVPRVLRQIFAPGSGTVATAIFEISMNSTLATAW